MLARKGAGNEKEQTVGKRLFLLDHCCVHRYFGHHAPSLLLFKAYFGDFFDEIVTLVPDSYDETADGFEPLLICPYPRIAFLSSKPGNTPRKGLAQRLRRSFDKRVARQLGAKGVETRMAKNTAALDQTYQFSPDDLLFFPNAEPYGVKAFCTYFAGKPPDQRPRLHFRMIGVHDAEAIEGDDPVSVVATSVLQAEQLGLDVQMSGETPRYVKRLQHVLPNAFLMPYPFSDWHKAGSKAPSAIGCLGQGRQDKGYFRIDGIIEKVAQTHPEAEWIIQSMRKSDPRYSADYQKRLERHANVRVEPGYLSDAELDALYAEASVSMLPYHEETYRLRGSAVLQEALAHGQLCIAPAGTGIASALEFFGNGLVARTDDEFAAAVGTLLDMPEKERLDRVRRAQTRYEEVLAQTVPKILRSHEVQ